MVPCDAFARVSAADQPHAAFEIGLAHALERVGAPVVAPDPRVEPSGYELDGFEVSVWTFHEPRTEEVSSAAYADALARLHAGMRSIEVTTPHFTDRVAHAERLVATPSLSPTLADTDRKVLIETFGRVRHEIGGRISTEQLLHGEPHPGNVLNTIDGALFIDLETCCRRPVEFDVAHAPRAVAAIYPELDLGLLSDCRELVLAMVAAWRFEAADQFPNGPAFGSALLVALRAGQPWPTVGEVLAG